MISSLLGFIDLPCIQISLVNILILLILKMSVWMDDLPFFLMHVLMGCKAFELFRTQGQAW